MFLWVTPGAGDQQRLADLAVADLRQTLGHGHREDQIAAVASGRQGQHLFVCLAGMGLAIALIFSWPFGRSLSARIRLPRIGASSLSAVGCELQLDAQIKNEFGETGDGL